MILSIEQINNYTEEQCRAAIQLLEQTYNFDEPILNYTDGIDQIVNQLLYLEDRIDYIKKLASIDLMNAAKLAKE